jgi:nucleoid-associated protein YgaU
LLSRSRGRPSKMNIRSILIALPSVYLVVALLLMGGQRSPRLPQLSTVPQRVLLFTQGGPPAPGALAAPVAAAAPAIRGGAAAAPAQALTPAEAMSKASPAPPKPAGAPYKVKYYDGNSVTIYPHADLGQGGSDWWPSVESGWEKDSLQTIRTLLTKT